MTSDIHKFLETKQLALAGVSRQKQKFGNSLYKTLTKRGYSIFPVHPELLEYEGTKCFSHVSDLPAETDGLIICTAPDQALILINEAVAHGIKQIWLQQGAENPELISSFNDKDINLITGKCILMYAEPVTSFHKFHRGLAKLFGKF